MVHTFSLNNIFSLKYNLISYTIYYLLYIIYFGHFGILNIYFCVYSTLWTSDVVMRLIVNRNLDHNVIILLLYILFVCLCVELILYIIFIYYNI